MAHYAHVNKDGIVDNVIVVEREFIDSGAVGDPTEWVQTSYNTHGGKHPNNKPLRKNYAGIGYKYDKDRDAFIPQKPTPDAILNEESCLWDIPMSKSETEL